MCWYVCERKCICEWPLFYGLWKTVRRVNGNNSRGGGIEAGITGPIIRWWGSCVVHASSSGLIFHDGSGKWLCGFGLLVQKGLNLQEHEEEQCGYSSCAGGVHTVLTCTNNCSDTLHFDHGLSRNPLINSDSSLPPCCSFVVFCWFVYQMIFVWQTQLKDLHCSHNAQ